MLKVAILGCGKIADDHAYQIRRIKGCQLVALCDAEPLMAKQMHERLGVPYFDDLNRVFDEARPDVVHITTPPQSHFSLAMRCVKAGCHVLVEKPFTMTADEAVTLIAEASKQRRKITVDHNLQFSDPAIRMRELIASGFLGGDPVHIEGYYCYDLSDTSYARAFLSDSAHWLRSLPGGLLQNVISHGIARIAEHLKTDHPSVTAQAFTSPLLRSLGEERILDELRVLIRDNAATAYFTFSSQMRPQVSQLRLFGPRNGLVIDDGQNLLIKLPGKKHKSYLEYVIPPLERSSQLIGSAISTVRKFAAGRLNMNSGMRILMQTFYESITDGGPLPVSYREIVLTARIMDDIFEQVTPRPHVIEDRVGVE